MYTERDRPFLLRRPLQTSLDTTFSPAFWRRDYPLRVFDHALGGGSDCRCRARGAEGVAGGLWLWGPSRAPAGPLTSSAARAGLAPCGGTGGTGPGCSRRPEPAGAALGLQLCFRFYETPWNSRPFPGKENVTLQDFC